MLLFDFKNNVLKFNTDLIISSALIGISTQTLMKQNSNLTQVKNKIFEIKSADELIKKEDIFDSLLNSGFVIS